MDASAPVVRGEAAPDAYLITLDRPPANALGLPLIGGLAAALDGAEAQGAPIVVIRSAVAGFFAAGADIKHMSTVDLAGFEAYGDALRAVLDRIESYPGVVIAAIEGLALGGGLELAAACALRVASETARFGVPEVKIGLIPGAGGTQRLPRLIGRGRALDLILTGRQADAAEAHAIGLVDRLVPAGEAEAAALALAAELRGSSASALRAGIAAVAAAYEPGDGFAVERRLVGEQFQGDGAEGLRAFVEKRPPRFA
jgi:enoyl-CoA hydratase/carnithine racemase